MRAGPSDDDWELLGLPPGASLGEARRAYRRLARATHPDAHAGAAPEERARRESAMAKLNAAFEAIEHARGHRRRTVYMERSGPRARVQVSGFRTHQNRFHPGVTLLRSGTPDLAALAELPEAAATAIDAVDLAGWPVTSADIRALAVLPNLRSLDLMWTGLLDEHLLDVAAITSLHHLRIAHTPIGSAGLPALVTLNRLVALDLGSTAVDDAGLALLPALPRLRVLGLRDCRVRGPGLIELARLPALRLVSTSRLPRRHRRALRRARPDIAFG